MKQLIGLALLGLVSVNAQAAVYNGINFSIETPETNASVVNNIFSINYNKSLDDAYGSSGKLLEFDTPFTLFVNQGWEVSAVKLTINTSYEFMVDLSYPLDHPAGVYYNAQSTLFPITLTGVADGLNKPSSPIGSNPVYSGQQSETGTWSYQWNQGLKGDIGYWLSNSIYVFAPIGTSAATIDSVSIQFITSPVPEPSSYALLGIGLGVLGFMARKNLIKDMIVKNIKLSALLFSIIVGFSQNSIAASYSGLGYTLTWDDAANLIFNGEYFEKNYGYSNSFSNLAYTKYTVDNFDIQIVVDNGYFINRVNMWLYGGYDTTILDTPANGSANITLDSRALREDGSLAGSYAGQGNLFNFNPANGLTRLPPDGDFIAYGIYASTYDPPINYMFEVSSSSYYLNNAIVNIDIDKIRIGFQVIQVPEPSNYAMLGFGLGLVGFAARRRKTR